MGTDRLAGKRVLVTSAEDYMGPAIVDLFIAEGADLVADIDPLTDPEAPGRLIAETGPVDAIVINLDLAAYGPKVTAIEEGAWLAGFDAMVHPLMRVVRAAAPAMIEAGSGSMVVMTSSSPLRRMKPHATPYVTARAAQNAFVRSAGHELAANGVRLNAIAQNFVENDTYFPPALMENERFVARLNREVPAQRLGTGSETAELALFLASEASSFIFGQVISQDGAGPDGALSAVLSPCAETLAYHSDDAVYGSVLMPRGVGGGYMATAVEDLFGARDRLRTRTRGRSTRWFEKRWTNLLTLP